MTRIDAETRMVEEERAKAEQINRKYREQLSDYKVSLAQQKSCAQAPVPLRLWELLPHVTT